MVMRQDAFNVDLRRMMPHVAYTRPCARGCHMILPDWVEMWKMTYMHFSFCSANGWKMPPTPASPSPQPFAKTFVIISYVLKEQIWHLRFMLSFHLAPVNDRGHGLSWVIIFSVVALLLKKKCLLNKIVLHHKMSCCVVFISLLNIGLLNVLSCDCWFFGSERWQWCKKSDYVQIQHLFFPDSSFHKGMVALSHASV